ncbi:MAG: thiamine pyrophosphate-binding protein [Lachnospiraceae bacterium]|nr:thiamine pyrophosphate-binding protein [Candidatus Darwinimomas equi]
MKIKVSNYISQKLVDFGITHAFSVVGGGAMHLNDALGHQDGLKVTYNHHEQASAIAAECYARIAGRIAALCVTTGPGGTNAITGVVGGWLDSIPMFVISGQVRYDWTARYSGVGVRAMGDQEFDICRAIGCMTKYSEMVIDPMKIRYCMEKAFYLANNGRPGPVWLDIPLDVQGAFVETDELEGFDPVREGYDKNVPEISEDTALEIINRIRESKRPVLNAGNGIRTGHAHEIFMQAAEKLGIPVVVGWNSQDCMPSTNPLYAGRPGNMGDRPGNFAVQNSDLVLSIGSRLGIRQVGFNSKGWAREAFTIVNDIDPEELKKPSLHVSMPVQGDCRQLLTVMNKVLDDMGASKDNPVWKDGEGLPGKTWRETCDYWLSKYPVIQLKHLIADDSKAANMYAFFKEIGDQARENQVIVVGNGSPCVAGGHGLTIKNGQRYVSNSAIASMGYGLPAAVGAFCANQDTGEYDKDIICLTGDGSIQMNLQELETVIFHKMNIKIFIINNGGYHSIRQTQKKFFGDRPLVGIGEDSGDLGFPDMEKLAWAYGFPYVKISTNSELKDKVAETLAAEGPVICEVYVTHDQNFEPKSSGKKMPDGTIQSPPLEDLEPFLPEEEMDENMIIPR